MDRITPEKRSFVMSHIHSKNTKPEIILRKHLFSKGFRYRIHSRKLPGKPDIVLPRYKSVIFVHGCFWHQHKGCALSKIPKSRVDYWVEKFEKNIKRDKFDQEQLAVAGWRVLVVWECELNKANDKKLMDIENWIRGTEGPIIQ